jgi:hypothetical protein
MAYYDIHPATHSVCGLAGGIHDEYRAEVTSITPASAHQEFVDLLLKDDMPKPAGSMRRPTLSIRVITPIGLRDYHEYRLGLWREIENYIRS